MRNKIKFFECFLRIKVKFLKRFKKSFSFNCQPFLSKTPTTIVLNSYDGKNNASGVLGGIRTHDLTIRNHTLYPAELQGHKKARNLQPVGKPLAEWIRFTCLLQLFV